MQLDSVNDIKYPKVTSILEDQSRGNGVKKGSRGAQDFPESTRQLKGHDLILGSLLFLTKKAPSPRFRINPFLHYDVKTGRILIPEYLAPIVDKVDTMLKGKNEYTDIEVLEIDEDIRD